MALEIDEFVPSMAIGESGKPLQTELDTLSTTSSVEYSYSEEEEYPRIFETDDEEDTTPTEQNTDEALNDTSFSALSCMVSNWFDDWPVSDEHLVKLMKSCEDSVARRREPFTWIHVYAYFNKKKGYGGYGVLVHNELGVPITASARFSKDGCSFYHQVFEGINAGVTLAGKLGRSHFCVWCNSCKLPSLFDHIDVCRNGKCKDRANADNICDRCDEYIMSELGCCPEVKLLALKLRQKDPIEFLFNPVGIAVHYLAKLGKKKGLAQKKEGRYATNEDWSGETGHEVQPAGLPLRLKHIIWGECFAMSSRRICEEDSIG